MPFHGDIYYLLFILFYFILLAYITVSEQIRALWQIWQWRSHGGGGFKVGQSAPISKKKMLKSERKRGERGRKSGKNIKIEEKEKKGMVFYLLSQFL